MTSSRAPCDKEFGELKTGSVPEWVSLLTCVCSSSSLFLLFLICFVLGQGVMVPYWLARNLLYRTVCLYLLSTQFKDICHHSQTAHLVLFLVSSSCLCVCVGGFKWVGRVCMCVSVLVFLCVHDHVCMCVCLEVRGREHVFSHCLSTLLF